MVHFSTAHNSSSKGGHWYIFAPALIRDASEYADSQKRGGITHQGRAILRSLMVQAAWTVIRSNKLPPDLQKWVRRLIVKRGVMVAVVALDRRLLILGHRLWKNGEAYNPNYPVVETATC